MRAIQLSKVVVAAVTAIWLAGCSGGDISNPISRKLNWFHYATGDSLRDNCAPGALNQYRLIYNADWDQQVRAYDLRESALGDGTAVLFTQVFGGGYGFNVSSFTLNDVFSPSGNGASGQVRLTADQYRIVVQVLNDSGFGQPAPTGLRLDSYDFYWIVSACVNGQFHFNAWRFPSARFAEIKFDAPLFQWDGTRVPPNLPSGKNPGGQFSQTEFPRSNTYGGTPYTFQFIVGDNGLAGM